MTVRALGDTSFTRTAERPWPGRRAGVVLGATLAMLALGLAVGGEVGRFAAVGLQSAPFLVLAVLATLGAERPALRVAAGLWLALILLTVAALSVILATVAMAPLDDLAGGPLDSRLLPLAAALLLILALGGLLLAPPARKVAARVVPIDAAWFPHAVALSALVVLTLAPLATLAALGGQPALLTAADNLAGASAASSNVLLDLVYGLAWLLPTTFVAAGFPIRRTFPATLARLGLVRPTARQWLAAVGLVPALLVGAWLLEALIAAVWQWFGWPRTDMTAFRLLLGAGYSVVGAVVIGVTAGLGEEVAVRGLLQPRVGWLLANLAFTAAHAYQYAPDVLVAVFVLGAALAAIRARSNTTIAVCVHAGYNTLTVLRAYLGW